MSEQNYGGFNFVQKIKTLFSMIKICVMHLLQVWDTQRIFIISKFFGIQYYVWLVYTPYTFYVSTIIIWYMKFYEVLLFISTMPSRNKGVMVVNLMHISIFICQLY
jgi:hypothetical protein